MKASRAIFPASMVLITAFSGYRCTPIDRPVDIEAIPLVDRPPRISPDYAGIMAPPSIAPLNFRILEEGTPYLVRVRSERGPALAVVGRSGDIRIPQSSWHALLDANRGNALRIDIAVKGASGQWQRFRTITDTIASDDIDPWLVYRRVNVIYNYMNTTGIYQRDLRSFSQKPVVRGLAFRPAGSVHYGGCVNCHAFQANTPERFTIGVRDPFYGVNTLVSDRGRTLCIPEKFGFVAWHPRGAMAVYSVNGFRQFFHSAGEVCEVVDMKSTLRQFSVDSARTSALPEINRPDSLETYPTWTPDGRELYYCRAPRLWDDSAKVPPAGHERVRYDLVRASYDDATGRWGAPQVVVSAAQTGRSILMPRISPDGRFMLVCMIDYGCFPIFRPESDLYIIDLQKARETGVFTCAKLSCSGPLSESWHCWSGNGRWIAFSSKRMGGNLTQIFLCAVDRSGNTSKPFVVPQKDPRFYDACTETMSVPELLTSPVTAGEEVLSQGLKRRPTARKVDPSLLRDRS